MFIASDYKQALDLYMEAIFRVNCKDITEREFQIVEDTYVVIAEMYEAGISSMHKHLPDRSNVKILQGRIRHQYFDYFDSVQQG